MRRTASSPRTPTAPGRASASWMTDLVPATDETEEWVDARRRPNTRPRNPRHPRWQRRRLRRSCVVASAALSTTVPLWALSSSATSAAFAAAFTGDRSPDAGARFRFPTAAQATIALRSRASWPGASGLPRKTTPAGTDADDRFADLRHLRRTLASNGSRSSGTRASSERRRLRLGRSLLAQSDHKHGRRLGRALGTLLLMQPVLGWPARPRPSFWANPRSAAACRARLAFTLPHEYQERGAVAGCRPIPAARLPLAG